MRFLSVRCQRSIFPYRWRRLMTEGGAAAVGSDEPVVGSSEELRLLTATPRSDEAMKLQDAARPADASAPAAWLLAELD